MEKIYSEKVINSIRNSILKNKKTLSVAESVTAGHLQAAFSTAKDASQFFQGGITVYNAGQKTRHLSVEPIYALNDDCVSATVSEQMALQVSKMFISDYGVAITGYAAPLPEKGIDKLFAFFAISFNDKILISKKIRTDKEGIAAQLDYTGQVLLAFEKVLR